MYIDDFIWLPDILEKLAVASGQTNAGRYLIVFFIHKAANTALILSVRDMDEKERRHMNESDDRVTSISQARTLEEIAEFWDTHSLADYWDQTREVEFELRAKRRRRVTLDPDVYAQVAAQAHARGLLPETLVNLWLAERLQETR
ncbi:MAG: CopG family antitoxin [Anaerolineae bacterium]